MKKKNILTAVVAMVMALAMSMTALAAGWQTGFDGQKARWWYLNDDNTWPANTWVWIDDNKDGVAQCYYFDAAGYVMTGTTTPDGYTVNATGEWTVNGVVQNKGEAVNANASANVNATGTSTKSLDDYGYTNGLNDLIYELPNLTKADVEAMFGDKAIVSDGASDGSGITSYKYGDERFYIRFNDSDGSFKNASLYFDRAFENLTADDVKNDGTVKRVAAYLEDHGFDPHIFAMDTNLVFRINSSGKTLRIDTNADGGRYKSGWADLVIVAEN